MKYKTCMSVFMLQELLFMYCLKKLSVFLSMSQSAPNQPELKCSSIFAGGRLQTSLKLNCSTPHIVHYSLLIMSNILLLNIKNKKGVEIKFNNRSKHRQNLKWQCGRGTSAWGGERLFNRCRGHAVHYTSLTRPTVDLQWSELVKLVCVSLSPPTF